MDIFAKENQRMNAAQEEQRLTPSQGSKKVKDAGLASQQKSAVVARDEPADRGADHSQTSPVQNPAEDRSNPVRKPGLDAKADRPDDQAGKIEEDRPAADPTLADEKAETTDAAVAAANAQAAAMQPPTQSETPLEGEKTGEALIQSGNLIASEALEGQIPPQGEIVTAGSLETGKQSGMAQDFEKAVQQANNTSASTGKAGIQDPAAVKSPGGETSALAGTSLQPTATTVTPAGNPQNNPAAAGEFQPVIETAENQAVPKAESAANGTPSPISPLPAENPGMTAGVSTARINEPARMAEARAPEIVQQVARQLEEMRNSHQTTLRMQLYPESMGRIDLKMTSTSQGIGVSIITDQSDTNLLLQRNLDQLRQNLLQAGVTLNSLDINSQAGFSQFGAGSRSGNPSLDSSRSSQPGSESPTGVSTPVQALERSLVDYRI
jgi:flagellar hook-length control protein FliK